MDRPPSSWLSSWLGFPLKRLRLPCPSGVGSATMTPPASPIWEPPGALACTRPDVTPTGMRRSPTCLMMIRLFARRVTAARTAASFASQSGRIWSAKQIHMVNNAVGQRRDIHTDGNDFRAGVGVALALTAPDGRLCIAGRGGGIDLCELWAAGGSRLNRSEIA